MMRTRISIKRSATMLALNSAIWLRIYADQHLGPLASILSFLAFAMVLVVSVPVAERQKPMRKRDLPLILAVLGIFGLFCLVNLWTPAWLDDYVLMPSAIAALWLVTSAVFVVAWYKRRGLPEEVPSVLPQSPEEPQPGPETW
jgi:hypothetical protein